METGMLTMSIVLWSIFSLASFLSLGLGFVLAYHLFRYSTKKSISFSAVSIYLGVSLAFIICLLALALAV